MNNEGTSSGDILYEVKEKLMEKNINRLIQDFSKEGKLNTNDVSDGYHTFGELYKHRIHLFIALCKSLSRDESWFEKVENRIIKSELHADGTGWDGWFLIQLETDEGQISYHLPMEYWDKCYFAETLERADKWDGHTPDDVLERLLLI